MSGRFTRVTRAVPACEIRRDPLSRQLYATDASIYQVEPQSVALPKSIEELSELMAATAEEGLPMTPRGAGTGLAGGALGRGMVIDLARHNRGISHLDVEARTVRAGAGVVLDQLNAYLQPHGLMFAPDVATSSRATIGGMINNNSSGARAPRFGATIDHVRSVRMALPGGRVVDFGPDPETLGGAAERVAAAIHAREDLIRERFHQGVVKRWPGYAVDRFLRNGGNFAALAGGSEGTLGAVWSAELNLVPAPREKGMGIVFFDSVVEAMEATVALLDLEPDAIEHIDDVLFDQTRGQLAFKAARDYLELDDLPCKSILMVEFSEQVEEKLSLFMEKSVGVRRKACRDNVTLNHIFELRKSGLSLLTSRKGDAKPTAGIEDVSVTPAQLPDYVRGLKAVMGAMGMEASFYGHAASGLLHVRPIVDLHDADDIRKFRKLAEEVSALTLQFKGSLAAEHGVGMARTEFMSEHLGPELLDLMAGIKQAFDPENLMNPGKIFPNPDIKIDRHLRQGAGSKVWDRDLPFEVRLGYVAKDESFVGHLEQCNGCGGCKKSAPTMCPTFVVTGEEIMSTRGRANAIRAAIEDRLPSKDNPVLGEDLMQALKYCLACKACKRECPSNVDMALLKAELLHARNRAKGTPLSSRMLARVDRLGETASRIPALANLMLERPFTRALLERAAGIDANAPLPRYAEQRFDHWFERRERAGQARPGDRGDVLLWDDCFCRYNDPNVGHAAVRVLEAADYEVLLPEGRACCGRPAFSTGQLELAASMARHNVRLLAQSPHPIVFLEPSCYSMFVQDYLELGVAGAKAIAERAVLFEDFMLTAMQSAPKPLPLRELNQRSAVHVHCHAKALTNPAAHAQLARSLPGNEVSVLPSGCCGMAGAFGMMRETRELSVRVAKPLLDLVENLPPGTRVVASGSSCRHQLASLSDAKPLHMAELMATALDEPWR